MNKYIWLFAIAGWIISLSVHIFSLRGTDVNEIFSATWLLQIGIIIVWIPAIFSLTKNQELRDLKKTQNGYMVSPLLFFKTLFNKTPKLLLIIAIAGFLYAGINFLIFMTTHSGTPVIREGQYILQSHGRLIKSITENEYHLYRANELSGASGHWIAFYGIAVALLYPHRKLQFA